MPYESAYEVFKKINATIPECADAIEELGVEYGYVLCSISLGIRKDADAEAELVRIKVLAIALKIKISELAKQIK